MIQVNSIILTAALLGHASAQGCYPAYITGASYSAGDIVSATTITETTSETHNYECRSAPNSLFCSMGAFAPNGVYSAEAWIKESAECMGTIEPTMSPSFNTDLPTSAPIFDELTLVGGCPDEYAADAGYDVGDQVSVDVLVYECMSGQCSQNGFEPGTSVGTGAQMVEFWRQAWTVVGHCSGSIGPTSSPSFDELTLVGGCPDEYAADAGYDVGDQVSVDGLVYECTRGLCSQNGFEPGTSVGIGAQIVEYWRQAWTVVGHCSGTIGPTSAPSFDELDDVGGCPDVWSAQTYDQGDLVSFMNLVFECTEGPLSSHCGQVGYEPNTAPGAWMIAWTVVGHCSGSIGPTGAPSFDPANSVGGCPDEWEMGSSASYEEGDMVSVTVSTMPLRQVAYRCNAWPLSGHCGQISPIEDGGDLGWTFAGSCDGTIGPTASPSFDALTVDASGCPEEFSASKTDYEAGDLVSFSVSDSPSRDLVYQCRESPNAQFCNQGATFAPDSESGTLAWTLIGACSGTLAPTYSPSQYDGTCQFIKCVIEETIETNCAPGSDGCSCLTGFPPGADCVKTIETENCTATDVDPWSSGVDYVEDDVVRLGAKQFRCREWPNFIWCNEEAYVPTMNDDDFWPQAWTAIEDCPP